MVDLVPRDVLTDPRKALAESPESPSVSGKARRTSVISAADRHVEGNQGLHSTRPGSVEPVPCFTKICTPSWLTLRGQGHIPRDRKTGLLDAEGPEMMTGEHVGVVVRDTESGGLGRRRESKA